MPKLYKTCSRKPQHRPTRSHRPPPACASACRPAHNRPASAPAPAPASRSHRRGTITSRNTDKTSSPGSSAISPLRTSHATSCLSDDRAPDTTPDRPTGRTFDVPAAGSQSPASVPNGQLLPIICKRNCIYGRYPNTVPHLPQILRILRVLSNRIYKTFWR